ncbi:hypothetical protein [Lichenicola cladoniae]|nr:hypothetical protein [Lichenicola cladoniae]
MLEALSNMTVQAMDGLSFGVLGLDAGSMVEKYNQYEERCSGLSRDRVVGRHCFFDVAPCMNNYLVAERLNNETELDEIIPYVLTFRMRPTRVRLRMLTGLTSSPRWILISRV